MKKKYQLLNIGLSITLSLKEWSKKIILLFYYAGREFGRDQCALRAAALTYVTLLSIVPVIILILAFFKSFGGEALIEEHIKPFIFNLLSSGAGQAVAEAIDQFVSNPSPGLMKSVGALALLFTAFTMLDQTHFTLNAIWGEKKSRPLLQRWMMYWASMTILPFLVALSISSTANVNRFREIQQFSESMAPWFYNMTPVIIQGTAFFLLYIFFPKVKVKFLSALVGAAAAAILWEIVKKYYIFYTTHLIFTNAIYGYLAVLPLFMIWLLMSWMTLLYGAEIAYTFQNFRLIQETSRKKMNISRQWFEALGLEIVIETALRFISGGNPVDPDEFAEMRALPRDLVRGAIDKLSAAKIIRHVESDIIIARDPETLTVDDVMEAMRSTVHSDPPFAHHGNLKELKNFLYTIESQDRQLKREWNIKMLAREVSKQ